MFQVLGIEKKIHPKLALKEIGDHWERFYQKMEEIQGQGLFAVYSNYQGNYTKPYQYLIGKQVPESYQLTEAEIKAGLTLWQVPELKYEVLNVKGNMPDALFHEWKKIWNDKEAERLYRVDYEVYKSDSEVDIYLSIK